MSAVSLTTTTTTRRNMTTQWIIGGALLVALMALPLLPSRMALSDLNLSLLGRFLTYAILALGLDLIWGYAGILSLGHGVYFGLGAYCMAMYLKLEASQGLPMPDFMAWSDVNKLPWWWQPFHHPWFAVAMGVLVPAILAAALGYLTFSRRVKGVFFSILSQALALVVVTLFVGQQGYTGGTNGMTNYKTIFGHDINATSTQHACFWLTVIALAALYIMARWLVAGRMGKILIAIRDGENRVRFSGYDPAMYKVFIYALSAGMAGLAGMLFVVQVGLITPTEMDITHSIKMVLWVALGGRATLTGAVLGAVLVNLAEYKFSVAFPTQWPYFMGALFLIVVLFLPAGVIGWAATMRQKLMPRRGSHEFSTDATKPEFESIERSTTDIAKNPVY